MRNRLKFVALLASVCTGTWLCAAVIAADQPAGPTVSKSVAKPLKAAQDALQAKKYDEALAHVKEAQSATGEKTAYDNFVINQLLSFLYYQKQDYVALAPILEIQTQSQYATAEQKKSWLKALLGIEYQQKEYAKTIEIGDQLVKQGVTDPDTYTTIADSQNKLGKYKEAAATIQEVIQRQEKPEERLLVFQWNCYVKSSDEADAAKVIEKLVTYYPKPDYWANALAPLGRVDIKDAHLQLNVYRLKNDVGVLRLPSDYAEMAEIALDAGYPGETQAVLQQAFAKNVFVEQRDKDRYQHLLDGAKQRAANDQSQLAESEHTAESAPNGNLLVQVGAAYITYGQYEKAVAAINKGIAKGGLKSSDEANLLLGIAQLRQKNYAAAQQAFDKVAASGNIGYARLGRLWALRAHSV